MNKYVVLATFLAIFGWLIRRDKVYVVPFILIAFSNVNGLLDWEDFALHGIVKFQDYGLVAALLWILIDPRLNWKTHSPEESLALYKALFVYWLYYFGEFLYSILLHGDIEWPVKMGRGFFYGLVVFVIVGRLRGDPIAKFEKILSALKICTVGFALLYVAYNMFGIDLYPRGAHEEFFVEGVGEVKRNFSGFPAFAFYFLIFFAYRLANGASAWFWNLMGMILMMLCVVLSLTRGNLITMVAVVAMAVLYRKPSLSSVRNLTLVVAGTSLMALFASVFAQGYVEVLVDRFSEFDVAGGVMQANNVQVRSLEFDRIVRNVMDFNPLLGFGFTNVSLLGRYETSVIHAGSPDNGFSNLIGVTGFLGLAIFLSLMLIWIYTNLKLQSLRKEAISRVNFIFIVFVFISFANGSAMTFMHTYALFMAYDLVAYGFLRRQAAQASSARNLLSGSRRSIA